jgi:hypothetical protein
MCFDLSTLLQSCCNGGDTWQRPISQAIDKLGGPDRTRTCDLRFRKPLLYPAELRDQSRCVYSTLYYPSHVSSAVYCAAI